MENYGIIYKIFNNINGKIYIGQTIKKLETRFIEHKCRAITEKNNSYLYNAIRKYKIHNFSIHKLCECNSRKNLDIMEEYYIFLYDSRNKNKGYNLKNGGNKNFWNENLKEKFRKYNHIFDFFTGKEYKQCPKCRKHKEVNRFYKNKRCWDKLTRCCKTCLSKKAKKSYQKYKEKRKNYQKEYSKNNEEKIRNYGKKYYEKNRKRILKNNNKYYNENKEKINLERRLKRRIGKIG